MTGRSLRRLDRDLGEMWDTFNDFFGDNFLTSFRGGVHQFRTDIKDNGDRYVIEAEMPGFDKDAINIDYENSYLTISAKREAINKDEKENYIRQERHYGEFVRRFFVEDIDDQNIEASFNNGVLTIICPKLAVTPPDRKRIEIN
ncbi:Hsp20/alpha crystallin family protein [Bacillus marasmi]|uniref:Hsp20/alpha crystallin family protein n=1 Tax=Bacillus marasmi TaxID=1926279 RepID=UPI0011CA6794|nr:Hsp20/alpha crystallin family protein [Bacillus marasmi]